MRKIVIPGASRIDQYLPLVRPGDFVYVSAGVPDIDWAGIAAFPFLHHSCESDFSAARCEEVFRRILRIGAKPVVMEIPEKSASECFEIVTRGMGESSRRNVLRWLGGTPEPIIGICRRQSRTVLSAARALGIPVRRGC